MRNGKMRRRAFLHGAGVTMGLPWLESLQGAVAEAPPHNPMTMTIQQYVRSQIGSFLKFASSFVANIIL